MESTFCWPGRHDIFVAFLLVFSSLVISLPSSQATRNFPYRAAVYEHAVVSPPPKVVSRTEAVENMMKNVRIYKQQTEVAANKQDGVGMTGPLLDNEDYPRSDIDVYSIRHARHRIKCLQTDHTQVMKQVEEKLLQIHANARDNRNNNTEAITGQPRLPPRVLHAFAKVDKVEPGSPASKANLQVGDELLRFGSIQHKNFQNLQDVGQVVQLSIGKSISVSVLRDGKEIRLTLIPNKWSGRGLLGCNIIPV